jgi:phage terminase small subunit
MKLLSLNEQIFVCELFDGATNIKQAAKKAGYRSQSDKGLGMIATRLMQNPRIIAALQAETRRRTAMLLPKAVRSMEALLDNPSRADHFKAVQLIHKTAFEEVRKKEAIDMAVDSISNRQAKMERIRELARKHGVTDLSRYLGLEASVQDAEFKEVTPQRKVDLEEFL